MAETKERRTVTKKDGAFMLAGIAHNYACWHSTHIAAQTSATGAVTAGRGQMDKAHKIIQDAERAALDHRGRTGSDKLAGAYYQIGYLQYELRKAYDLLAAATNPSDCHDVTIDGITYGMQWDKGDECWLAYIGGQVVNVALSSELIDKLCDEAERIALDGEAA